MRLTRSLPDLITQKNTFTVDCHTTNQINKLVIGLHDIMSQGDEVLKKLKSLLSLQS